ncbi:MAG: ABC transporter substrate-binding protein [Ruminococcaceae bacterium]|nr:ABC transporter substrate-binding protein [Oscillospiraceae bacterium]
MKKLTAILLCVLMILPFVSCTKKEENEITVVLDWTPNTNHTGLYVALEKGFYEELGLKVNIQQPPEDGATSLVASGKAEFGVDFQDYLAAAYATDDPLPVTAVAALIQHNTSGIISMADKGINSAKDLEGKSYATWDLPIEKAMIKDCMEKEGGDFSKLELIPSTVTDTMTAIQTNVDSVWIYYAWDGVACETKGLETNYFAFKDIDPAFDYYTPVLIANNSFLKDSPELAKAFLEATQKGYEYAIEDPGKAADILLKYAPELDRDIVKASQEYLAKEYIADAKRWGEFDQKRWDAFFDYLWDNKLTEKEIADGFGFTNDYLPE